MANLIASGVTAANSADIVVAANVPTTIHINDANGGTLQGDAKAALQIKATSGQYTTIAELTREKPAIVIDGPGTYRVARRPGSVAAFAVDQD